MTAYSRFKLIFMLTLLAFLILAARAAHAQTAPLPVKWVCKTAEDVRTLVDTPDQIFEGSLIRFIEEGDCMAAPWDSYFAFSITEVAGSYEPESSTAYTVVKGVLDGGTEVFASMKTEHANEVLGRAL